jgi:DNA-binding MurR/RpiR family transcriptional regulator
MSVSILVLEKRMLHFCSNCGILCPISNQGEAPKIAEETVSDKITAAFPRLSRRQKQVARFVVDDESFVAFASAAEVAQKADVSTATVVRFCQTLGYEGYSHLQAAIRQRFPRFTTTVQRLEERLTFPMPKSDLLARVFAVDIDNIKRTMELVDSDTFEAAVTEIGRATGILVVGEGHSASPALFFAHSLKVMGFSVQVVPTGGVPLSLELGALRPSDLLIGICFWRYFRETIKAMRWAGEIGARRIAISDSELSPLNQLADYAFIVAINGVAHSLSPVAAFSLISAFVAALSFQRPQQTLTALRSVDAVYKASELLLEE